MPLRMTIAWVVVAGLLAGCGDEDGARRRDDELRRAYDAGVAEARSDISSGRAILYVDDFRYDAEVRIDRETGLVLRDAVLGCGTDVDTQAYEMGIAGYRAEVARALAAGELERGPLAAKLPDEAALRARFEGEDPVVVDTPEGRLTTPGGVELTWRSAPRDARFVSFDLVDPASGVFHPLPFNRRPLRVLWDHEGTTLIALGMDGTLATVDIPSGTWIAVFPGR